MPKSQAPDCSGTFCTQDCKPGTIDCGGSCVCQNQQCLVRLAQQPGEPVVPGEKETPESCAAKGGEWQLRFAGPFCNYHASDAGKPCSSQKECEGMCIAKDPMHKQGSCSEFKTVFGCVSILADTGMPTVLCID